jgi:hypothetical protein
MRKSLLGAAGVSLMIGLMVSCGDTQSGSVPDSDGASGQAGDGAGGKGSGNQGGNAGGSSPGGSAGASGGDAASGNGPENPGGSGEATGGALGVAGANMGEGGSSLGEGGTASGGVGGEAGVGGDAAGAGGSPTEVPTCDDLQVMTEDIYSELYGCAHLSDDAPGGGDGWLKYDAGFFVDERTGLAWSPITTSGSLEAAKTFCANLEIGSLVDWQVPVIDQVRASFAGGCPATAPTGGCTIHDPTNLSTTDVYSAACESCIGSATSAYCPKNAPFCSWIKTSSVCSDCTGSQGWTYGPTNGNFAAIDLSSSLGISCVIADLPAGVP